MNAFANGNETGRDSGADPGFLKGGGPGTDTRFFTSTPPLDIVRVTSPDLRKFEKHPHRKFEKHPHSWTFTKGGGPTLGPMLKPTSWPKRGGSGPPGPPPWIRHWDSSRHASLPCARVKTVKHSKLHIRFSDAHLNTKTVDGYSG